MLHRRTEGHYDALDSMDEHDVRFFIPVRKRGALRGSETRAKRKLAHRAAPLQEGVYRETPQARLSVETRRLAARGGHVPVAHVWLTKWFPHQKNYIPGKLFLIISFPALPA